MTSKLRVRYKRATYHIYNRGILKKQIFLDENAILFFLDKLEEGAEKYSVEVHAYCIMGNHFHILATTNEANISEFMHRLQTAYVVYMVKRGWVGHVFAGRFEAQVIKEKEYLLNLIKYIHLNPVRAAMVGRPEAYPWSSYRDYISPDANGSQTWLEKGLLLGQFGPDPIVASERFERFVLSGMEDATPFPREEIVARSIMGSECFVEEVRELLDGVRIPSNTSGRKLLLKARGLMEVYGEVLSHFGLKTLQIDLVDIEQDRARVREARRTFIFLAREHTIATNGEIARMLGDVFEAAVSKQYGKMRRLRKSGGLGLNNPGIIELDERLKGKVKNRDPAGGKGLAGVCEKS